MVNNYKIRGGEVEAVRHNGSVQDAAYIRKWISERGGNSEYLGTYDQEVEKLRIRLNSPRQPNIVGPGWWVVRSKDGYFFAVSPIDFDIIYEEIVPEGEEPKPFNWGRDK